MDIQNQVTKTNFSPVFQTFERKENNNVNLNTPNDSVDLYDMSYDMQLTKAYYGGGHIFNGNMNGKNSEIKMVWLTDKNIEAGGNIGDKKFTLTCTNRGKNNTGTFNGKDFNIDVEFRDKKCDFVKKMSGTIDGKPFELDFTKQPKVPKDNDIRDITNLILFPNGALPFIIDGRIVKLVISPHANNFFENEANKRENIKNGFKNGFKNSGKDIAKEILRGIATFASGLLVANFKKILKMPTQ